MDAIACACFSSSKLTDRFENLEIPDSVSVLDASSGGLTRHERLSKQAGFVR